MDKYRKYYFLLFLLYFIILASRHVGHSELVYFGGDESRHFMNGVFFKDLFVDGGWRAPFQYLRWYYLKYPALSVHQYPPLFYFLEAVIFAIFGINVIAVQLLIFTLMGISFWLWYKYLERKFPPEIALFSLFIATSTHLFLNNFARIMLDGLAFSFSLWLLYAVDRWSVGKERKYLWLTIVLLGVIVGIAFTAYFLVFYVALYAVYHRVSARSLQQQWQALLVTFVLIFALFFTFGTVAVITKIPLLYRTMQGVNMMSFFKIQKLFLSYDVTSLFRFNLIRIVGVPLILLTVIGILFVIRQKDWQKWLNDCLYAANFVFIFTFCITHFEPERFNLFLLPCIALLSGYALYHLINVGSRSATESWPNQSLPRAQRLRYIPQYLGMFGVILFCIWQGLTHPTAYLRGYEQAAGDVIALNPDGAPVLCDAYLDGNFIAYLRQHDPEKRQIILRGDKLFFAFAIYYKYIQKTYIETEQDIYDILDRYSIRYIVADHLVLGLAPKALFRKVLHNQSKFRHIKTYPVATNLDYTDAALDVYEYLEYHTDYDRVVNINLPVMGTAYSFTVQELRKPF